MNRQRASAAQTLHSRATQPRLAGDRDALVRLALEGDKAALDVLVRELRTWLLYEARRHLRDGEDAADDLVQDVFVAILEGRLRAPPGAGAAMALLWATTGKLARLRISSSVTSRFPNR